MPINTNALKKFAQEARKKLMSQVEAKLEYVLTSDSAELREKANQLSKLQQEISSSSKEEVIDKVSYTWFNRLMALRFMDANDYQPIGLRVITPKEGYTLPELLDEAKQGSIPDELPVKHQRIYDILDGKIPSSNSQNEAFKELLIGACNHLNKVFPFLFEKINDYAELLLPDDLTSEFSLVQDIQNGMTDEDCLDVEVIGWIYQFYISEKKDEVFASKGKVKKEDIPAATQLFTPRWIVEYMVQNTVGKLWLQNNPGSSLKEHMPYYIESPSSSTEEYLKVDSVEEITLLDQACGSGHILVYGFELFTKIYEEQGYNPGAIPQLIIQNNLHGFEIDERAAQLASLALMMKARQYHRRVFNKEMKTNILCYHDLKLDIGEIKDVFSQIKVSLSDELLHDLLEMQNGSNFGSLMIPKSTVKELNEILNEIANVLTSTSDAFLKYNLSEITISLKQIKRIGVKYHCIVDNPPYMGGGKTNKELSAFIKINYPKSKADISTCFIDSAINSTLKNGFIAMVTLDSWMFLSSFEEFRKSLLETTTINTMVHVGWNCFPLGHIYNRGTAFSIKNSDIIDEGVFYNLSDVPAIIDKKKLFEDQHRKGAYFKVKQTEFQHISSSPIGYWLSNEEYEIFSNNPLLSEFSKTKQGLITGDNDRFLRFWYETKFYKFDERNKWFPINKGGEYRRWYGNHEHIINWQDQGFEIINFVDENGKQRSRPQNLDFNFKPSISWGLVSSAKFSARWYSDEFMFNVAGISMFPEPKLTLYILGFLNTPLAEKFTSIVNPTINSNVGDIEKLPLVIDDNKLETISNLSSESIDISREYWDTREKSWGFKKNELIRHRGFDLEDSYDSLVQYWNKKHSCLHANEQELNNEFFEIYNLEITDNEEISKEDISILKDETYIKDDQLFFDRKELLIQFVSYSIGCLFGRYSLDESGLILTQHGENLDDYLEKINKSESDISLLPDDDNIIPILDDEWFDDDIVGRFYEFLKVTFGKENFDKNLAFVEECLGKDIRKFFVKDFYIDHIKRYKKRPIYWMFSSPKGSFNVLVYMHRYTPDTLNQILNGYLKEYREKLNTRMEHLDHLIETGSSKEQTSAAKEKDKLKLVLLELQEYERDVLYPLATERIAIDLDDGVLVNYNKFGKAIKQVNGLNDKKTKDKVLKFDWIKTEEIR